MNRCERLRNAEKLACFALASLPGYDVGGLYRECERERECYSTSYDYRHKDIEIRFPIDFTRGTTRGCVVVVSSL